MSAYEALAGCYDELTYDIRYEKTLTFFERLCAREQCQPHLVLDLACGTGSLSMLLAGRGYRVIGADLSEDMLAEAERKARELPECSRPFFICQPMQRLRLAEPVDAVICALDSLNYLTRPDDCRKTLRRVYNALKSGGLFVFDINTPTKLRGLDGQVFLDETDDSYCVWRTEFDAKKRLCFYGMDIFRLNGSLWDRSFEEHIEYAYEPDELACGSKRRASHTSGNMATACCAHQSRMSSAFIFPQRRTDYERRTCTRHDEGRLCKRRRRHHDRHCRACAADP